MKKYMYETLHIKYRLKTKKRKIKKWVYAVDKNSLIGKTIE